MLRLSQGHHDTTCRFTCQFWFERYANMPSFVESANLPGFSEFSHEG
uniref:Uncharacterized protein n=1 Tax=Parascaris equorum TaxID=6256 RepID=A0A914R6V3_PAREQ